MQNAECRMQKSKMQTPTGDVPGSVCILNSAF
jgi:hypothetical protein